MKLPEKGIYRHFKGKRYELLDFATHSETMETLVVYRALYGEYGLWVRPLEMWSEIVERDGKRFRRFMPETEYLQMKQAQDNQISPRQETPPEPTYDFADADFQNGSRDFADEAARAQADPKDVLRRVYGYEDFREGQEDVINSILENRDTLAVLPTGAGKSICYQIPAQLLDGVAIVVSPLISLMKDQVNALTQAGVPAAYLNSSLSERQFDEALRRMAAGYYRIVYVAPERLMTQRFLRAAEKLQISMLAVDEAHCISQWGQDFRPSYLEIPEFMDRLPVKPRLCAFTATATENVKRDIIRLLRMKDPDVFVTGFDRPNLYFAVCHTHEKDKKLMELMEGYRGFSGIVYCGTRKEVESVHEKLLKKGYLATRYHAGLSEEERRHNQEEFVYDRIPVMVATNAFGMGIDKSNVRFVIHFTMPKDIESYYQEAGRAGRDGERADCHLLYEPKDILLQQFFIDKMGEETELDPETLGRVQESARVRLRAMTEYCKTPKCLRRSILRYFGDNAENTCGYCANCLSPKPLVDVTSAARIILDFVNEYNNRFGLRLMIDVLRGNDGERIRNLGLDDSGNYGALKGMSLENVQFITDSMLEEGLISVSEGRYPLVRVAKQANALNHTDYMLLATQIEAKKPAKQASAEDKMPKDINPELFELLRGLRKKISRARSLPPYTICNDATLIDMCRKMPTDVYQMRFIKGMGERKIQSIGREFAKVIREFSEK